jgi:hypothetical protein
VKLGQCARISPIQFPLSDNFVTELSRRLTINPLALSFIGKAGRPVRLVLITLGTLTGAAGIACAVGQFFTHEIPLKGGEERAYVKVSAPYGSLILGSTSSTGLLAYLEGHGDNGEEPSMRSRYVVRGTTGILNLTVGEDEGTLHPEQLASAHRAASSFSLVGSGNNRYSDEGQVFYIGDGRDYSYTRAAYTPTHASTRLFLTKKIPLALDAEMGFGESVLDLSGLWLQNLNLEIGANQANVFVRSPNPGTMDTCSVSAGVGEFSMEGIGFLNASKFDFNGGFGRYRLNFAGRLKKNLEANVSIGLGMVSIRVPPDAGRLQVFYDDGVFCSYNFAGIAKRRDGYATSAGFEQSNAPILTLRITSGAGKVSVIYK